MGWYQGGGSGEGEGGGGEHGIVGRGGREVTGGGRHETAMCTSIRKGEASYTGSTSAFHVYTAYILGVLKGRTTIPHLRAWPCRLI